MSDDVPRHKARAPRRHRVRNRILIGLCVVVVVVSTGLVVAYKKLESNINAVSITRALGADRPAAVKPTGPQAPLNILVMGSDSRAGTHIGGQTPGLSDTAILLHLSADRKSAYGVSIPRDSMVQRPSCLSKDGKHQVPAGLTQFNAAYAIGGPACTVKTVEHLTHIRIDHFVVVNFNGFKDMVNALGGVSVCVPTEVNDTEGHIHLPKGTYKVTGEQALDYVRVRHDLGAPTGDIGRMRRQQSFISAMIKKVVSGGTLANPVRLYDFLDAATRSLTTDPEFANLRVLAGLGQQLKDIGLDRIKFITVPNMPWPQDPNRLVWTSQANVLWRKMRLDKPLGSALGAGAVSPGQPKPGTGTPTSSPSGPSSPGSTAPSTPSSQQQEQQRKADAAAAGLCA